MSASSNGPSGSPKKFKPVVTGRTMSMGANELDLLIKLLAYNLFERFKRDCCEPVHQSYTISRFRLEPFHCAAILIQHSRAIVLKLMKDFAGRYAWKRIEAKVALLD
ncbi:hypothetical protein P4S91_24995 [Aneurinibacillus aneurinilyticus]|nr:hypothetical protein [Aneurinibacillus aneurinilyticus]MCI1696761.1 hypothetical protein [Aneurinibacillus aneurinilyticus]MED0709319.1 hypothetical protein [Aneurinibacillus aneurinilyticus]MED0726133.1 hypothetical protein [Aneurinibacillus aneurinilyticus]MED0734585.1 hypothetical protein [Aneurinibacillus aneurinilyticus]MED0742360.1 hypothetical protein [Aneurinibacillus aneurinilyticus]